MAITIKPDTTYKLELGRQMTYGVRSIEFDLSEFISTYGDGTATIVHQRSADTAPYIVCSGSSGDTSITWEISQTDTTYAGTGKGELRFVTDDGLEKTAIFITYVHASITADTEIPEALESWYDAMIEYIDGKIADADQYAIGPGLTLSLNNGILTVTEDE